MYDIIPPQKPPVPTSPPNAPNVPVPIIGDSEPPHKEGLKSILSTFLIVLAAIPIALLLTTYIFQSYEVEGPSMRETLHDSDRLVVLKTARTLARITGNTYIPNRGDIVIFTNNGLEAGSDPNKQLIKRVIALPGERVKLHEGILTVYNDDHPEGYQPDKEFANAAIIHTPFGEGEWVVPPDHLFVSGDNRSNSHDSRTFGPIPAKDVVGKLALRIFPFSKAQKF